MPPAGRNPQKLKILLILKASMAGRRCLQPVKSQNHQSEGLGRFKPLWRAFAIPALFPAPVNYIFVILNFCCTNGETPGTFSAGATPWRVVRVKKFQRNFSIGAASAADLFTTIANFPTTPQSVLHQCRNLLGFLPPYPPQWSCTSVNRFREFLHSCKKKVHVYKK